MTRPADPSTYIQGQPCTACAGTLYYRKQPTKCVTCHQKYSKARYSMYKQEVLPTVSPLTELASVWFNK